MTVKGHTGIRRGAGLARGFAAAILALGPAVTATAQPPTARSGEVVPRDVREMYDRGLQYLAASQKENGEWSSSGTEHGAGATGIGLLAFLASGEDPNFGLY